MVPKFNHFFYPLLKYIEDGEEYVMSKIWEDFRDKSFPNLTEDEKEEAIKSGRNRIYDRVLWAKTYLHKAGLIDLTGRGVIRISERGKKVLGERNELTVKDLYFYNSLGKSQQKTDEEEVVDEDDDKTPQDLIDEGVAKIKAGVKYELLELLKGVNPYYFEKIILDLLEKMGYGDVKKTPKSGDGGIDGIINQDKLGIDKIYIQAKRFTENKVGRVDIQKFGGAMGGRVNKGIFVTTSSFHFNAKEELEKQFPKIIILIDGEKLADLLYEYEIGIQTTGLYKIKAVDNDYFEEN